MPGSMDLRASNVSAPPVPATDHVQDHHINFTLFFFVYIYGFATAPRYRNLVPQHLQDLAAHINDHVFVIHEKDCPLTPCYVC